MTRFYLGTPSTALTPAFSSAWDVTTSAQRASAVTVPSGGTTTLSPVGPGAANKNRLIAQYISAPLPAQRIMGTVTGQIRANEVSASNDYCPQVVIRVFSGDGLTQRGVLFGPDNSALSHEFAVSTLTNRGFPRGSSGTTLPLTLVQALAGDVLVIEVGYRSLSSSANNGVISFNSNPGAAGDLPADETTTTALRSWIEFSTDLFNPPHHGGFMSSKKAAKGRMVTTAVPHRTFMYDNSRIYGRKPFR